MRTGWICVTVALCLLLCRDRVSLSAGTSSRWGGGVQGTRTRTRSGSELLPSVQNRSFTVMSSRPLSPSDQVL